MFIIVYIRGAVVVIRNVCDSINKTLENVQQNTRHNNIVKEVPQRTVKCGSKEEQGRSNNICVLVGDCRRTVRSSIVTNLKE